MMRRRSRRRIPVIPGLAKRRVRSVLAISVVSLCAIAVFKLCESSVGRRIPAALAASAAAAYASAPSVKQMLEEMGAIFSQKIEEDFSLSVQIDLTPRQSWHIVVEPGGHVVVGEGPDQRAQFIISTSVETLRMMYEGKMTGLTAAGKAHGAEVAPLELQPVEDIEFTPELRVKVFSFIQHFFNRSMPERVLLREEHSRMVHGGHAIPLYYHPGFRSAWYLLKKGERLNEPGDTNPFHQAFVFISGEGFAKIGDETITVKAGESYYIPPGSDHVVWTESEEPLVLIFLAWGEGA